MLDGVFCLLSVHSGGLAHENRPSSPAGSGGPSTQPGENELQIETVPAETGYMVVMIGTDRFSPPN